LGFALILVWKRSEAQALPPTPEAPPKSR
jgi:hypothetical protein